MSKKSKKIIKCWEYFKCSETECSCYKSSDGRCWIHNNTYCYKRKQEMWLEKMELCIDCKVLKSNIRPEDLKGIVKLTSRQFKTYKKKISKEQRELTRAKEELENFKISSIYLLKEMNENNIKISSEKTDLDKLLNDKSKRLNDIEKKYMQSAKLVTMGKFSAGIAHEINNPLGAVINYIRMVLSNPQVKDQNKGYLELAIKGLFRIEKIIKDILYFSGNKNPNFQKTDVNKLISEAVAFVYHKYEKKKIKLNINLENKDLYAFVDPHQINQLLINILNNAIDAIDYEGKISIRANTDDEYINIVIKDNGKGISKDHLDEVFEPFFTTKEVGKGTGMGLFVCYNIINLNNGTIDIKSKQGKGTTVYISLPEEK